MAPKLHSSFEHLRRRVGPYLSGKLQPGPGSAGARPWIHCNYLLHCIRVDVASFLPLRRELGATLGYGWRLLGYLCWLSAAGPFESHAPSAFAGCRLRLACEGGLLSAFVEQNKNILRPGLDLGILGVTQYWKSENAGYNNSLVRCRRTFAYPTGG